MACRAPAALEVTGLKVKTLNFSKVGSMTKAQTTRSPNLALARRITCSIDDSDEELKDSLKDLRAELKAAQCVLETALTSIITMPELVDRKGEKFEGKFSQQLDSFKEQAKDLATKEQVAALGVATKEQVATIGRTLDKTIKFGSVFTSVTIILLLSGSDAKQILLALVNLVQKLIGF